jgi:hypothetical protein
MTRANGGLIFQGLMWLNPMQLQMSAWMPAINHKEHVSKVKARPDSESRGQRDFFDKS